MNSIYHYTLSTGHMRRSLAREVKKEVRARVRELIKFERKVACNYTVPFLTITAEVKEENVILLTTVGCKDETGLPLAMKAIDNAQKDSTGKKLKGYHPKIPFIVDITTPYCILIAKWSGDFCRTLAWSIFDDSETSED